MDLQDILRALKPCSERSHHGWLGHVGILDTDAAAAGHGGCRDSHRGSPRCWLTRLTGLAVSTRCVCVLDGRGRRGVYGMTAAVSPRAAVLGERSAAVWAQAGAPSSCASALGVSSAMPSRTGRCRRRRRSDQCASSLPRTPLSRLSWSSFGCRWWWANAREVWALRCVPPRLGG